MENRFDTSLKDSMAQFVKQYLRDNLSVIVETEPPGWMEDSHTITVKLSLDGEIIDSSSDTIYVPR